MKPTLVLFVLLVAFVLLEVLPGGAFGPIGSLAWSTLLAIAFATAATFLASSSAWFVGIAVAVITAALPLALLVVVAYPGTGSVGKAVSLLAAHLAHAPAESAAQLLLPLACTLWVSRALQARNKRA
jgi:hypothetical protein